MVGLIRQAMQLDNLWRADFPAMTSTMNGEPLVYLDSGSSAQKPWPVIDALISAFKDDYANIHRGFLSTRATIKINERLTVHGRCHGREIGSP